MPPKITQPGPIPQEALDYFEAKGLTPSFSWADVWAEEHSASFTVAKILELDVLATVRGSIDRAIEQGTTFEKWRKEIKPILNRSGWSDYPKTKKGELARLRVIYDTNMRTSRAAGQWQRIERTKIVLPFLRYAIGPAIRHTPMCLDWNGTILPVDDPWWSDHFPPNHYRCTGHVLQAGEREVERRGGVTDRPPTHDVTWKLPDGSETKSPVGVHPSFNYNPGKDRTHGLFEALKIAENK